VPVAFLEFVRSHQGDIFCAESIFLHQKIPPLP
jgi:hypothetical protein